MPVGEGDGEGKDEEEGKVQGTPRRQSVYWVLYLGAFSLLQVGILGEDFSRLYISFPGVPFRVMVSTDDWSAPG